MKQDAKEAVCEEKEVQQTPEQEPQAQQAPEKEEKQEEKKEVSPEEQIVLLQKALAEMEDKRLRLLAEMENQRKRAVKDLESTRYRVMTDTLLPFFQVFDHFTMAMAATESSNNIQSLVAGLKMIGSEFDRAFSDLGIERIDATGKDFDPATQEAMSQEASETVPAGKVIRQWNYGYKLGDHLLKAANVVVSSGPAEKKEEAESGTEEK